MKSAIFHRLKVQTYSEIWGYLLTQLLHGIVTK